MIGAPMSEMEKHDALFSIALATDRKGRDMDEKWGVNRLQTLVPAEWAEKFKRQARNFSLALESKDLDETRKHGASLERAYAKLDEMASAAGYVPGPAEQWEFETVEGLVILVKDSSRTGQVERNGRACQVWSLDEIASVIRNHPEIVKAKLAFPGAVLESMRPGKVALDADDLEIGF
jgi:hypothetical protein